MSAIVVANACTWGSPLSSILTLFKSLYTFSMVAVFCHSNLSMVVSPSGNNFAFIGGGWEVNNDSCTRLLLSKCLAALDTPILWNQKQSPPQEGFGGLGGRGLNHLVDFDSTCLMPQYRFWHMACIESWYLIPQYLNRCFRLAVFPDVVTFLKHFLLYCEVGCNSWTRFLPSQSLGTPPRTPESKEMASQHSIFILIFILSLIYLFCWVGWGGGRWCWFGYLYCVRFHLYMPLVKWWFYQYAWSDVYLWNETWAAILNAIENSSWHIQWKS